MSVSSVRYPITNEVRAAVERFPNLQQLPKLLKADPSNLEIVRLLDNTHYSQVGELLRLIDHALPRASSIAHRLLAQTDPFQFDRALAEIYAFAHIDAHCPDSVRPTTGEQSQTHPDLEVRWEDMQVQMEIYCPIDFMGLQMIETYVRTIFKYLDVAIGYSLELRLQLAEKGDFAYPFSIEDESTILAWLSDLAICARRWLSTTTLPGSKVFTGPGGHWFVNANMTEVFEEPRARQISFGSPTRSTDTRLFFEVGTIDDTVRSVWGRKLMKKLSKRQCGPPSPNKLRLLLVDFRLADTGWRDFICWPEIATRMERVVKVISDALDPPLSYDAVLPAQLGFNSCFGPAIWLDENLRTRASQFFVDAGLAIRCEASSSNFEMDWAEWLRDHRHNSESDS